MVLICRGFNCERYFANGCAGYSRPQLTISVRRNVSGERYQKSASCQQSSNENMKQKSPMTTVRRKIHWSDPY
jgi:hypothetical protein